MFNKILLAYNGSREGKSALLACAEIAKFAKSETHLLAVAGMPSSMFLTEGFLPEELLEEEKKRAQEILNEGIAQLKKKGFTVAGHLAVGEPVEEISRLAAELKCDLIVVGHKQKAAFGSRWWRGSVGKTLLDHAPCSTHRAVFLWRRRGIDFHARDAGRSQGGAFALRSTVFSVGRYRPCVLTGHRAMWWQLSRTIDAFLSKAS